MPTNSLLSNPFKVFTPEGMTAKDAVDLFVEVSDFNKIHDEGNTILNGPRGSGKSMLFRYLMPDCQMIARGTALSDLPFFAVLVPIKNTNPNITELRRLQLQSARAILNEHLLTCFVASKLFKAIMDTAPPTPEPLWQQATVDLYESVADGFRRSGGTVQSASLQPPYTDVLAACLNLCDTAYADTTLYAKRLSFSQSPLAYEGALCDFTTFLCPLIERVRGLPYFPDAAVYLLIDDADLLSPDQTRIVNSWIATRTSSTVSIKLSTQHDYSTFQTFSGQQIRAPHDYQEINMLDIYTTKHSAYVSNVHDIVVKRLIKAETAVDDPAEFFPVDEDQEASIRDIANEIKGNWPTSGRGHRVSDDVARYARPEFIRRLGGPAKSTSTYSYAGFEQLVHISSGQVRYFLEPAAEMYDEAKAESGGAPVSFIRTGIQNQAVRKEADKLMFTDFEKIRNDTDLENTTADDSHREVIDRLRNVVRFLGGLFYRKLVSEDSERRVFSVAVSGDPDRDVSAIFEVGVGHGFFHRSSIGNKDGTGRTRLYVLTRRLAPYFNLDPSSFAGYQFITNNRLRESMAHPDRLLRRIRETGFDSLTDDRQLELFQNENDNT